MEAQRILPRPKLLRSSPGLPLPLQAKLDIRARKHNRSTKGEVIAIVTEVLMQDELHPDQELSKAILEI